MGVEVAHDNRVANDAVKEGFEVRAITGGAGGRRWKIDVVDGDREMAQMNVDGLYLGVKIGVEGISVDRRKLHVMGDKECEAAAAPRRTITAKEGIPRKDRVSGARAQFSFLDARDLNVILMKEG